MLGHLHEGRKKLLLRKKFLLLFGFSWPPDLVECREGELDHAEADERGKCVEVRTLIVSYVSERRCKYVLSLLTQSSSFDRVQ